MGVNQPTKHKIETLLQNVGKTNWTTKTRGWVVGVKEEEMGAVIRHAVIQSGEVSGLTWGPHERVKRGAWGTSQGSASQYVTVTWQASVTVISMFYFHTLS